jgi:phage-related holin
MKENKSGTFINENYQLFFVLCFLSLLVGEASKYFLDTNALLYASLSEKLTPKQMETMFTKDVKWLILGYLVIPVFYFLKTHFIAGVLGLGTIVFNKEVSHKKLWNIVLKAEMIFIVVIIAKTVWFLFFKTSYTFEELQGFYPLSLVNLISPDSLEPWYVYPLQVANAFELLYWVILALMLNRILNETKTSTGFKIVAASYGPALLIWVVGVMFFTLNIT